VDVRRLLEPEEEFSLRVEPAARAAARPAARQASAICVAHAIAAWIRPGVRIDGVPTARAAAHALRGQCVELTIEKRPRDSAAALDDLLALPVLARGDGWLAVEKPAGVPCHPTGNTIKRTLLTALTLAYASESDPGGPRLPHRLDRATSGLVLVALTQAAQVRIAAAFARGVVRRCYDARVRGDASARLLRDFAPLDVHLRLARCGDAPPRFRVDPSGISAHTRIRLVTPGRDASELVLEPVTGRQHQLRVHLAHLGHAIIGDPLYDPMAEAGERMQLHARTLELPAGVVGNASPIQLETAAPDFAPASSRSIR
jgi:23S rRNA pseudouridine1911/1915/1917 synthase